MATVATDVVIQTARRTDWVILFTLEASALPLAEPDLSGTLTVEAVIKPYADIGPLCDRGF